MGIQYTLELVGTTFFAVSGALAASDKSKPDWFGVSFIGFITATGGGSLRDMLLGSYPLTWVNNVNFIYAIIGGVFFASLFMTQLKKIKPYLLVFDTLGMALFTILGTEKALNFGVEPAIAAIMGMLSAVMGGVIRDVLTNEIPVIFRKEIYATASIAGAALYLYLNHLNVDRMPAILSSIFLISVIRFVAVKYNLSLPKFGRKSL
ncbi:MAG: trimeric intracellular cation channel family protein [Bacteroidia bacterium]|nr:trimeric intracellular cation channel family protein [Bacteroidia bacterium]